MHDLEAPIEGYYIPLFHLVVREDFKYYFADFVRKGGTPPPPFTDFFSGKKGVTDLGGTPPQWANPEQKRKVKVDQK